MKPEKSKKSFSSYAQETWQDEGVPLSTPVISRYTCLCVLLLEASEEQGLQKHTSLIWWLSVNSCSALRALQGKWTEGCLSHGDHASVSDRCGEARNDAFQG
ncbi:Dna Replication Licensing Factor Mcm2 [Manis pentadactyla]|nr:Dna Replication Licensing Factor Mcm2 [Manis pentadactyla]